MQRVLGVVRLRGDACRRTRHGTVHQRVRARLLETVPRHLAGPMPDVRPRGEVLRGGVAWMKLRAIGPRGHRLCLKRQGQHQQQDQEAKRESHALQLGLTEFDGSPRTGIMQQFINNQIPAHA
jgi:hypothetical protein